MSWADRIALRVGVGRCEHCFAGFARLAGFAGETAEAEEGVGDVAADVDAAAGLVDRTWVGGVDRDGADLLFDGDEELSLIHI